MVGEPAFVAGCVCFASSDVFFMSDLLVGPPNDGDGVVFFFPPGVMSHSFVPLVGGTTGVGSSLIDGVPSLPELIVPEAPPFLCLGGVPVCPRVGVPSQDAGGAGMVLRWKELPPLEAGSTKFVGGSPVDPSVLSGRLGPEPGDDDGAG